MHVAVWFVILVRVYFLTLRKKNTVEETEITLQWPTATPSLMVNSIWERTRMVLRCAWLVTAVCVNRLLQRLNLKCFKLLLSSLRSCLAPCKTALSFYTHQRDGQRSFLDGKKVALKDTKLWHIVNVVFSSVSETAVPKQHLRRAILIRRDIYKLPSVVVHELLYPKDKGVVVEIIIPGFDS